MDKDIFGKALTDYYNGNYTEDIVTWTNISDKDMLPLPYLFRSFDDMPFLEQKALQLAHGSILDVGCGAGSHSLYLQKQGQMVKTIDSSKGAITVAKQRGVLDTEWNNLLDYAKQTTERFDTILLLMNGTGIFQELKQVSTYLKALKQLLNPRGQILIDSSDIIYMYDDENELEDEIKYYGELDYFLSYKNVEEVPMKWLYLDFETLSSECLKIGFKCEFIAEGGHYDYLAKLFV